MTVETKINSLSDFAERLLSKPPTLQNVRGEDVVRYLNGAVSDVREDLVAQLLTAEHCTTAMDQKQYNEMVATGMLLHLLAFVGRYEAIKWLLDNGAHPHVLNHKNSTPLHVAAARNHPEVIRLLRFNHADAYTENNDKETALDVGGSVDEVKESLLAYRFSGEEVEDEFLQDRLPALVERVCEPKSTEDQLQALLSLRAEMRMATSSMTSVPKPLKLLREHFSRLEEVYKNLSPSPSQLVLADILSVQGMAMDDKERKILQYRLLGSQEKISSFGHPYVRRLCAEIPEQWLEEESPESVLLELVKTIAQFCLEHSAEAEVCDMLMEIEKIDMIVDLVEKDVHGRVCLYLISCVKYVPEPEDSILLHTALKIYRRFGCYPQALRLALMLNDLPLTKQVFLECKDRLVRKQLAFMLGRQQVFLNLDEEEEEGGGEVQDAEDLADVMSNNHLNSNFLNLGRELDIMEPKVPEDIYKTHLEHSRFSTANTVDSARANLAASFVNGFVNAGFAEDKLLCDPKWIYKHKGVGMLSATASLGLILLWDVEGGLTQIDKMLYSNEDYIKSGALLACGLVNVGIRNDIDPALALLADYVVHASNTMRIGAIIGLGLAYAGSGREDVIEVLSPVLWNSGSSFEVVCLAALSCSMICVGTCNGDITENILQVMMEQEGAELNKTHARYLALALALLYLGKQEAMDATVEALKVVPEPLSTFASTLLEICAYAGTGNVLKIQHLLHMCSEYHGNKDEEGGAGEEATDSEPAKEGAAASGGAASGGSGSGSGGDASKGKKAASAAKESTAKKVATSGASKDVEMKDAEAAEAGSLSEPGAHQAIAVLGIALIAMGEDIGAEMALRTFNHLLHYGDPVIRRAVPLALALLSMSNPQLAILDTLSKFSHDSDPTVARNAIFAMGLVGSGTNNARLAGMLRNLAQFYHKEPQDLFMVRLAQGLTHLGKGTLTLNPYHSDRMLMTPVAVAGILSVLVSMLDANIILRDSHYMLFFLAPAIQPRMLVTFDEDLNRLPVTVRVGQAVDVVGQAGKPKTITGFQTHTTPVLLASGERAELATEEYCPLTPIIEGFVILKKNPDYVE